MQSIRQLQYFTKLLLPLVEIDYRINQLKKGLIKLNNNMKNIYKYIETIGNKIINLTLINPIFGLKTILNNGISIISNNLSLPYNPNTDFWIYYDFWNIESNIHEKNY